MYSLKFGGTSMGSAERISEVADIVLMDKKLVKSVVVSAMSGVTDLLLKASVFAKSGDLDQAHVLIKEIEVKHIQAIAKLITNENQRDEAENFIFFQIQKLEEFLEAISVIQEISARSHDEIVSLGEKLSAYLLAVHLQDRGHKSEFVNLENIVDKSFLQVNKDFFEKVSQALATRVNPLLEDGVIPIITGFFGRIPGGIVGAVGRGYSDFTASLVGSACGAKEIQIWTDVSGILSADPRIVTDAIALEELSFSEASELANFGAKVIHPQTIWPAVKSDIPVRIKNTMKPSDEGTLITSSGKDSGSPFKSVTAKKNITVLTMHSFEMSGHGFMGKIFQLFANYEVSIDLISTSEASVSVTIDKGFTNITALINHLSDFCKVEKQEEKAILAIIGEEMSGKVGVAGQLFTALGESGINVQMISQGATELNISAVIDESKVNKAIESIHNYFFES